MVKKFIAFILIICILFLLTACGNGDKAPRVEIVPTNWTIDTTYLPLRANHIFAEVPYSIEETNNGYNIIIHCIKVK